MSFSAQVPNDLCTHVPRIVPDANGILSWIGGAVEKVSGWIGQGFQWISDLFGQSEIGGVFARIKEAFAKFQELIQQIKDAAAKLLEIIKGVAMPWILPSYADRWSQMSEKLGQAGETMGPQALRAPMNAEWTGHAAQQYQTASAQYSAAANHASAIAMSHSSRLQEAATQGQNLYTSLLGIVLSLLATILSIATKTGTIVGIPVAVATAAIEIPRLILQIINFIQQIKTFIQSQEAAVEAIAQELKGAQDHFPGGKWRPLSQVG